MKVLRTFLALLSIFVCASCGPPAQPPKCLIILADVSASIVPEARAQMFTAIREMITHLERGDAITIMPVATDASGNLQGHILRFEVPTVREPYDEDRKRFRKTVGKALASMEAESMRVPASRTDLLGTLAIAGEEFKRERQRETMLIIFSDFLEDDKAFKFANHIALRGPRSARLLAERLALDKAMFPGTPIFCGELRSTEWLALAEGRRTAVREFWTTYLTAIGGKVSFAVDGPAMAAGLAHDRASTKRF
jgi:hypothetical protein